MATSQITIDPKIRQDFASLEKSAAAIAKSLSVALSGGTNAGADLEKKFMQISKTAEQLTKAKLKEVTEIFKGAGGQLQLTGKDLQAYAEAQAKAFESKTIQSFLSSLREIQKQTGLNAEEMHAYVASLPVSDDIKEQFTAKSELEWWLDDRAAKLSEGSDKKLKSFLDETIPNSLGKAADAFGDLFFGIAQGTQHSSELFKDLGKTVLQIANDIANDFMRVAMRMALFGSAENGGGGLFGGFINLIGSGISSLFAPTYSYGAMNSDIASGSFGSLSLNAKGNVFSSPTLAG